MSRSNQKKRTKKYRNKNIRNKKKHRFQITKSPRTFTTVVFLLFVVGALHRKPAPACSFDEQTVAKRTVLRMAQVFQCRHVRVDGHVGFHGHVVQRQSSHSSRHLQKKKTVNRTKTQESISNNISEEIRVSMKKHK
jgi:hypothetical protein